MSVPDSTKQGQKRKREEKERHSKQSHQASEKKEGKSSSNTTASTEPSGATTRPASEDRKATKSFPKGQKYINNKSHNPLAAKRDALQQVRQKLPIWPRAADIRKRLLDNNVLILTAETGSGKSTQVPQFLLASPWCTGRIAVTQPRRVAAISLARRVAEEMGSPLGKTSPTAQVGYSVRFDDNTGRSNKIKFLTEGMLLQEMLRDSALTEYSCVLVDEVHERSVNVDLILGFLRGLVTGTSEASKKRKGKPLKVVIMSATADTEALMRFFHEGIEQAKIGAPVSSLEKSNATTTETTEDADEDDMMIKVKGRQYTVETNYLPEPTQDILEAALLRIFEIHRKEPLPGDILVFLTGQDAVLDLQRSVEETIPAVITLDSGLPKVNPATFTTQLVAFSDNLLTASSPPVVRCSSSSTTTADLWSRSAQHS